MKFVCAPQMANGERQMANGVKQMLHDCLTAASKHYHKDFGRE